MTPADLTRRLTRDAAHASERMLDLTTTHDDDDAAAGARTAAMFAASTLADRARDLTGALESGEGVEYRTARLIDAYRHLDTIARRLDVLGMHDHCLGDLLDAATLLDREVEA